MMLGEARPRDARPPGLQERGNFRKVFVQSDIEADASLLPTDFEHSWPLARQLPRCSTPVEAERMSRSFLTDKIVITAPNL